MNFKHLLILTLLVGGCSSADRLIPVTGKVNVNGKPAEGAVLMFHPADVSKATASAIAEADGGFKIFSNGESGLVQGKYQVTVIYPDPAKKPTQAQIMMGTADVGPDLLKGKYASKTATTLTAEITQASTALPAFEL